MVSAVWLADALAVAPTDALAVSWETEEDASELAAAVSPETEEIASELAAAVSLTAASEVEVAGAAVSDV